MLTRRRLCLVAAAAALLPPRTLLSQAPPATPRPDVADVDRDHILSAAGHALDLHPSANLASGAIPALTAGSVLLRLSDPARSQSFAAAAAAHLRYLFVAPETRLENQLAETNHPDDLLPLAPLAEIAQAVPFLAPQPGSDLPASLSAADLATVKTWFAGLLTSLNTSRTGGLARDRQDHVGGTWLLVATACARLTTNDAALTALRHLFRTVTLRAQILADGTLPHELTTRNPYRNSLFALDLLAAACDLLSTRFESLWTFELQDGPGLRVAIARYAPWIARRDTWPYPADQTLFHDLPCRRPCLLLAARAYGNADYATIWRGLTPPEPTAPELLATFPLRQPLLWVTRPTR